MHISHSFFSWGKQGPRPYHLPFSHFIGKGGRTLKPGHRGGGTTSVVEGAAKRRSG